MAAEETEIGMATRHVAEQEGRIARQHLLIGRLQGIGAPLDDAFDLLAAMHSLLDDMRAHVARISH